MESLFILAGLLFIGAPLILLFLVVGARSRVAALERRVERLHDELQGLRGRPERKPEVNAEELAVGDPAPLPTKREDVAGPDELAENARDEGRWPEFAAAPFRQSQPERAASDVPQIFGRKSSAQPEVEHAPETMAAAAKADTGTDTGADPRSTTAYPAFDMPATPAWLLTAKAWLLGGNLVAKAGLLILFLGVGFLIKYAAARVSLPIELRLSGIVLADIALLLWGWRIRQSRPAISLPVQGAALAILMLVTFGAFRLYGLIPSVLAFALLFCLTFFTCLLAVLQDARWLAVFGIVGGFAAPIVTSTGDGNHVALFSYYALLNAGILAIALKRSWRLLNVLGFAFTFIIGTAWGVLRYQPQDYLSAQFFLLLFFVFYVAIAVFYASRQAPQLKHYVDGTLVFGTPLVAFGLQCGLVYDKPFGLALSALALGLFYVVLSLALWRRRGGTLALLVESFLALAIVFGTLAIPFALDGRWTSAAWALEGAGIVWVGLRQKRKLAWMFGLLVQAGAWLSFVGAHWTYWRFELFELFGFGFGGWGGGWGEWWGGRYAAVPEVATNLFASDFLGGLLLALAAGFTSHIFHLHGKAGGRHILSRTLLGVGAYWWFVVVLGRLNDWGAALLDAHEIFIETAYPLVHPLYALLVALGAVAFTRLARRLHWPDLRWLAYAAWPCLLGTLLRLFAQLDSTTHFIPPWPLWSALLALWLAGEYLLRAGAGEGWLAANDHPRVLRVVHTLRTAGPWLLLWPLLQNAVTLWLQADTGAQAIVLAESGWFTSGSWARYLPAWVMMACVGLLIPRTRAGRWPTSPIADWYARVLIPLASVGALALAAIWNFSENGLMAPLPYLPMLNPLDLTTGFAGLLAVAAWRLRNDGPALPVPTRLLVLAACAAYVWFNLMLLRTAAHFLDIDYQWAPLFRSQFVQAMLSLVWSATALILMRVAAGRVQRLPWMAGAGLLVLVVGKLFFVDLSNVGGIERIVSFVGVGLLMLAIGYLAPFPAEAAASPEKFGVAE